MARCWRPRLTSWPLCSLANLIQWLGRYVDPTAPTALVINGNEGFWKRRFGEAADRDGDQAWLGVHFVENCRPAFGAEAIGDVATFIAYPHELRRPPANFDLFLVEPGVPTEGAACPALAGQAMTNRHANGFAGAGCRQLFARTFCNALDHGGRMPHHPHRWQIRKDFRKVVSRETRQALWSQARRFDFLVGATGIEPVTR